MTKFNVRVQPGAKQTRVVGRFGDSWKLAIQAPPVDGKANSALIRFLAGALRVPPSAVSIVSGHSSRTKRVAVEGVSEQTVLDKLTET